ncbi:unnamed protein product [Rotaria sp. Silwood2]|nr:unnamed protein product [Rotaria sp. Silwood2]
MPGNTNNNTTTSGSVKTRPTTHTDDSQKVTDQKHEISPIIGVCGDYTIRTDEVHKTIILPDFGDVKKKEGTEMNKIYEGQSYNHQELIQLEHTKTEICTVCEQVPAEKMIRFKQAFHSIPFYIESDIVVTGTMIDQGNQLAYLLKGLANHVFKVSITIIHIFRDVNSNKIAFNYGGAIFFNLRYFEQVYADELKPYLRKCTQSTAIIHTVVNFYFMVFCHELTHNISKPHNEYFVCWLENIAVKFMTSKDMFLEQFSFEKYKQQT